MKNLLVALFALVLVGCGTEGASLETPAADSTAVDSAVVVTVEAAVSVTADSTATTTVTE